MKKIIIFFSLLAFALHFNAQNILKFEYDKSGNRKERIIDLKKSAIASEPETFIEKINEFTVKIYPNPTKGQLKVEMPESDKVKTYTITINSMTSGKQIIKTKGKLPVTDIDISFQPNGIYIMIININEEITTWKIMKQ